MNAPQFFFGFILGTWLGIGIGLLIMLNEKRSEGGRVMKPNLANMLFLYCVVVFGICLIAYLGSKP